MPTSTSTFPVVIVLVLVLFRYEDVARNPYEELVSLCNFLNISVPPESQDFVAEHSSAEWGSNR